ncbi:E3 ubiquitin-protein ligase SP1, partial [Diplonema papillatum]
MMLLGIVTILVLGVVYCVCPLLCAIKWRARRQRAESRPQGAAAAGTRDGSGADHVVLELGTGVGLRVSRPVMPRRGSFPLQCVICSEWIHSALYDGHLEVCKSQQRRVFKQNQEAVAEKLREQEAAERAAAESDDSGGSSSKEENTCVICLASARAVAFVPCGHWACCRACCSMVDSCPLCRGPITKRLYVDGATVNKCKVCRLQIHHTFYTSHREVCRLQMRTREREREEADRAAAQAAAAADGIDAAAVVVTVDADPQPAPAPHGGEGASGEHAGDDGAMAADQTCSDQPLLSPRGGSVVCGSAVGAAPADEASDQRPNAKAASSLCCVCLKNPRQ